MVLWLTQWFLGHRRWYNLQSFHTFWKETLALSIVSCRLPTTALLPIWIASAGDPHIHRTASIEGHMSGSYVPVELPLSFGRYMNASSRDPYSQRNTHGWNQLWLCVPHYQCKSYRQRYGSVRDRQAPPYAIYLIHCLLVKWWFQLSVGLVTRGTIKRYDSLFSSKSVGTDSSKWHIQKVGEHYTIRNVRYGEYIGLEAHPKDNVSAVGVAQDFKWNIVRDQEDPSVYRWLRYSTFLKSYLYEKGSLCPAPVSILTWLTTGATKVTPRSQFGAHGKDVTNAGISDSVSIYHLTF